MKEKIKILFLKKINEAELYKLKFNYHSIDLVSIEILNLEQNKLPKRVRDCTHHIITSKNTVEAIKNLELQGKFYCVGEKVSEKLNRQGRKVVAMEYSAEGLCKKLEEMSVSFANYFCGDNRLNTIPKFFNENSNRNLNEIICYKSVLTPVEFQEEFDAYVFFSPSGVESFFTKNNIPKNKMVFALGETTGVKLKEKEISTVILPKIAKLDSLIDMINQLL